MPGPPEVSIVIPVRNEEGSVTELARRLGEVLPPAHEILFIDDGSTDGTWNRLTSLHQPDRLRLVRIPPSGKSAALMAGFARCRAPVVFTMDGDLQDDPDQIPAFLARLDEGLDVVSGWKRVRHDPLHKVIASRIFNFVLRHATGLDLHDMNCGFKCYRSEVTASLAIYGEQHRFIPVFAQHAGYRVGEIEVRHRPRRHGRSKYGMSRLLKGAIDLGTVLLRTRYGDRPAHAFGLAALLLALAGAAVLGAAPWLGQFRAAGALLVAGGFLGAASGAFLAAGWLAEALLSQSVHSGARSCQPDVRESRD